MTSGLPGAPVPIRRNILIHGGATFYDDFPWTDKGEPLSLAGLTAVMSIARHLGANPVVTVTSTDNEIQLEPGGATGLVRVIVSDTKTAALDWPSRKGTLGKGYYDLVVVDESVTPRRVFRVAQGEVSVDRGITRLADDQREAD